MKPVSGMTPDRWHQITEIFHATRKRRVEEREAFLDQACASDPSLRHHVEAMISAHDEAGQFGESPLTMSPAVPRQLLPGTMLREFRIESLIGAGGMGEVYRATDTVLGRAVAIKVLPDTLVDDPERLARLDREARVLASINHPHIAAIYALVEGPTRGAGRSPGKALVLELVAGTTLADRLRSGSSRASSVRALSIAEALELAQQIGAALEAAHDKGIIHRDLKPANIALTQDGAVKVLDFGLAKPIESSIANESLVSISASSTREGMIVGTAAYMSPEQARGAKVDKRTDVWAFGCVLYEMLTGRRAFAGDTVSDTLVAVLEHEPDWNALPTETPSHVRRLLKRMLQRNVALRFRDIGDARLELSQPIEVEALVGTPTPLLPRRVAIMATAVIAAVATAMLFLGSRIGTTSHPSSGSAAPVFRQLTFRRGAISMARFAADGRNIVYSASWDGRPAELFTGSLDGPESRALGWPAGVLFGISRTNQVALSIGCDRDPGGCFGGTLATAPLSGGAPRELSTYIVNAEWTPDGELVIARALPRNPMRLEIPAGHVVHEAGVIRLFRIHSNGTVIAATTSPSPGGEESLVVITRDGNARTLSSGWQAITGLAWSPSGDEVWFTGTRDQQPALQAISLQGGERRVLSLPAKIRLYDISADGTLLLGTDATSNVTVLNGPDDDVERPYSWFDLGWAVGLSADGRHMLFNERGRAVQGRSTMYLRATDGKSAAIRLGEGRALALSPDGSMALALRSTPSGEQLVLLPTGAGEAVPLVRGSVETYEPNYAGFFDDGRRVFFYGFRRGEGMRAFVQESPSAEPRAITPDLSYVSSAGVISPDMKWLAASVPGATPRDTRHVLFPVGGGDPRPLSALPSDLPVIQWTPDGSEVYARRWAPFEQRADSDIVLLSLRTGKLRPFRTIRVSDPAGAGSPRGVMITRDGQTYTYNYPQTLQDLYVVTGLR